MINLVHALLITPFLFFSQFNMEKNNAIFSVFNKVTESKTFFSKPQIIMEIKGANGNKSTYNFADESITLNGGGTYGNGLSPTLQFNVGIQPPNTGVILIDGRESATVILSIVGNYQFADIDDVEWEPMSYDTQNIGNDPKVVGSVNIQVKKISKKVRKLIFSNSGAYKGVINYRFKTLFKAAE